MATQQRNVFKPGLATGSAIVDVAIGALLISRFSLDGDILRQSRNHAAADRNKTLIRPRHHYRVTGNRRLLPLYCQHNANHRR